VQRRRVGLGGAAAAAGRGGGAGEPKVFVGYSDHTSIHIWLAREAGLVTFLWADGGGGLWACGWIRSGELGASVGGDSEWALTASDGLRVLRAGVAERTLAGRIVFPILAEGLGTPYAMLPRRRRACCFSRHWDQAVPVGPDAAASALRGMLEQVAGSCSATCAVRRGGGGCAAGGGDSACA